MSSHGFGGGERTAARPGNATQPFGQATDPLGDAYEEYGFVILRNHGVSESLIARKLLRCSGLQRAISCAS